MITDEHMSISVMPDRAKAQPYEHFAERKNHTRTAANMRTKIVIPSWWEKYVSPKAATMGIIRGMPEKGRKYAYQ